MTKTPNTSEIPEWPSHIDDAQSPDWFMKGDGFDYAGTHLLLDCWDASHLDNIDHIERALRSAVKVSGATLLHIHLHHFTPNGGVSGVAVLAESHISIHTWPERDYAALDVFMCGDTTPMNAIPVFEDAFKTKNIIVTENLRGKVFNDNTTENREQS